MHNSPWTNVLFFFFPAHSITIHSRRYMIARNWFLRSRFIKILAPTLWLSILVDKDWKDNSIIKGLPINRSGGIRLQPFKYSIGWRHTLLPLWFFIPVLFLSYPIRPFFVSSHQLWGGCAPPPPLLERKTIYLTEWITPINSHLKNLIKYQLFTDEGYCHLEPRSNYLGIEIVPREAIMDYASGDVTLDR